MRLTKEDYIKEFGLVDDYGNGMGYRKRITKNHELCYYAQDQSFRLQGKMGGFTMDLSHLSLTEIITFLTLFHKIYKGHD